MKGPLLSDVPDKEYNNKNLEAVRPSTWIHQNNVLQYFPGLTVDIYAPELLLHGTRIYLAHIATTIRFADLTNFQSPCVRLLVNDSISCVMRDNAALQRQHRLIG